MWCLQAYSRLADKALHRGAIKISPSQFRANSMLTSFSKSSR